MPTMMNIRFCAFPAPYSQEFVEPPIPQQKTTHRVPRSGRGKRHKTRNE